MDCAGDQGKFWEMRRELYARQADLLAAGSLDGGLQFIAEDLGVQAPAFRACMADPARLAAVEADARDSLASGVRQRPTFDVAGERLVGLHRADEFARLLGG
jgi:protein-disulfide isomerase